MDKRHTSKSNNIICINCGQFVPENIWAKRKQRGRQDWDHCVDCTAKPLDKLTFHHPALGQIQCYPHKGEVNELWQPLDALGELYKPGVRLCGYKDCVNSAHIVNATVEVVAELDLALLGMQVNGGQRRVS